MPRRGESIYKRKDGRWEGRLLKQDGKYRYVYGRSYREVKEKKRNYQNDMGTDLKKTSGKGVEASELFENWLKGDISSRVKPSTFESYYTCARKYVIPFFNKSKEKQITEQSVGLFVKSVYENASLAGTYKKKLITIFKVMLRDILKDTGRCESILNAVKLPKAENPQIQVFSRREQHLIESEILKEFDCRGFGILLCFYTGIRLGELCALQWESIDIEEGTMCISQTVTRTKAFSNNDSRTNLVIGVPKSFHSVRKIPLPRFLIELIKRSEIAGGYFVFSGSDKPSDPRTCQKYFKKILNRAGVKDRKFHAVRHTFATRALENGVDIKTLSEILGHSSAVITLRVYAHSLMEQKIAAINKLGEIYVAQAEIDPFAVTFSVNRD